MTRLRGILAALIAAATLLTTAPAQAQPPDGDDGRDPAAEDVMAQLDAADGDRLSLEEIDDLDDLGPMPWLSFTPGRSRQSIEAWTAVAAQLPDRAQVPRGKAGIGGPALAFSESEAPGQTGVNDSPGTGELIRKFGTNPGDRQVVDITGSLSGGVVRPPIEGDCESLEDDGSIPLANPTPAAEIQVALCIGEIGDGPFGDSSGDIDFYSYGTVEEGTLLILDTFHISGSLDPVRSVIGIYDAGGNLLASIEDAGLPGDDPFIEVIAPADGEYFAAVAGCCELSSDPFDSASGPGVGDTGTYEVFVVAFPPPCVSEEDDGSIGQANTTNVPATDFDFCTGAIGDGPYPDADVDFYSLGTAEAGEVGFIDVFAFDTPFRSILGVYDADGNLVASAEDSGDIEQPDFLEVEFPATGEYYLAVAGCCGLPADPFDSASGSPSDETGLYEVLLEVIPPPPPPCLSVEDDGAIPLANDVTGFDDPEIFVAECTGIVGDGPQAELAGDVDFFRTRPLPEGRLLIVDFFDPGIGTNAGDLTIGIYDDSGTLLATGQDDPSQSGPLSQFFSFLIPADGTYFVTLGGAMPTDPFNPASGTDTDITTDYFMFVVDTTEDFLGTGLTRWGSRTDAGSGSAGRKALADGPLSAVSAKLEARRLTAQAEAEAAAEENAVDIDFFLVDLDKGDAISGGFDNARTVGILDPAGVQRSGATFNPSFIYPLGSPLRHDRRNGFDHVASEDGVHAVFVTDGIAEYEGELRVIRAGLADERSRAQQIIFLDFDGGFVSGDVWGTGVDADLSPLADFLDRWGLTPDDEDAIIDATIDAVVETLDEDLRVIDGRNGDRDRSLKPTEFDVEILNSRDHGDRWGDRNVSRVIVGGTIDQLQIPTIGIAQSIDPGNVDTEETAVVLLDVMSEPAGGSASLNTYPVADGVDKTEFIGFTVGHITAHEIGHFIGNWHQETFNEVEALMDAGGDFPAIAGVGDDGIFGTADDTDPDFVEDIFNVFEGFTGIEDTAGRSVFALSTGRLRVPGPPPSIGRRR